MNSQYISNLLICVFEWPDASRLAHTECEGLRNMFGNNHHLCGCICAVIVHNWHTPAWNKHLLVFKCFFVYGRHERCCESDLRSAFPPAQLQSVGLLLVSTGSLWFTCCLSLFNVFHLFDNSPETHSKTDPTPNKTRVSRGARKSPSRYQESLSHDRPYCRWHLQHLN